MNDKERAIKSIELQIKSIDETLNALNMTRNDLLVKLERLE